MTGRVRIGCIILALCLLSLPAWGIEYRLQVTHLDFRNFSAHLDPVAGTPGGQEAMSRLEARLDQMEFPPAAVIPGREIHLLEDPAYGGTIPRRLSALPAMRDQAWTTLVWEGTPGERVAFMVRSEMAAWQEIWQLAANPQGMLRRLTIGGPGLFGGPAREVPIVSRDYIANAADQGTFIPWLEENAQPVDGMRFVIGRRHEVFTSADRLYMVLTLPPQPHTFKVVLGWRDYDDRGRGGRFFDPLF